MRTIAAAGVITLLSISTQAQAPARPPADPTKAIYISAADLAGQVSKLPADRNGNINGLLRAAPYSVNIEHRVPVAQNASVHETEAELFYIIDGSATIVTGGTLIEPTRNGANLSSTKGIANGTSQKLGKGDFVMVPAGVPHWFTDIQGSITQMALHLPMPASK